MFTNIQCFKKPESSHFMHNHFSSDNGTWDYLFDKFVFDKCLVEKIYEVSIQFFYYIFSIFVVYLNTMTDQFLFFGLPWYQKWYQKLFNRFFSMITNKYGWFFTDLELLNFFHLFAKGLLFDKDSSHRSEFPVFQNFHHHKMWLFYSMFSATFKTNWVTPLSKNINPWNYIIFIYLSWDIYFIFST